MGILETRSPILFITESITVDITGSMKGVNMLVTGIVLILIGLIMVIMWAFKQGVAGGARAMKEVIKDKYEDLRS